MLQFWSLGGTLEASSSKLVEVVSFFWNFFLVFLPNFIFRFSLFYLIILQKNSYFVILQGFLEELWNYLFIP
jgi:hypothetical protein